MGSEAVEAEAIDQEMGHASPGRLLRHVAVELPVDDGELLSGQHPGVAVRIAERLVVEQVLAEDVGAQHREVRPVHSDAPGELPLAGAQAALSGSRRALAIHHHGSLLGGESAQPLRADGGFDAGFDQVPDILASELVAHPVGDEAREQARIADHPAVARAHRAHHLCQGEAEGLSLAIPVHGGTLPRRHRPFFPFDTGGPLLRTGG